MNVGNPRRKIEAENKFTRNFNWLGFVHMQQLLKLVISARTLKMKKKCSY